MAKRTKRLSPYVENELWQKDELLSIIKYEPFKRNKAILLFKNSIVLKFQHHSTAIERLFFLIGLEFSIGLKFYGVENFLE